MPIFFKHISFIFLTLFISANTSAFTPNSLSADSSFQSLCYKHPHRYEPFKFQSFVSLSFVRLPYDWVETENSTTMLNAATRLGLPAHLNFEVNIKATPSSILLRFGPELDLKYRHFSIGIGVNAAYSYLSVKEYGYTNKSYGWSAFPGIAVGYYHNNLAFTIVGELDIALRGTISSEDIIVMQSKRRLSGKSIGFYLEQKFHRNTVMTIGFVNNFQKNYFTTWLVQTTFNRYYYIPQVYIGLVL